MHVAEQAVEHFLSTIQKISYQHRSGEYSRDLAELLDFWLTSGGVEILGRSYENFLQMVVILLTDPSQASGVKFLVISGRDRREIRKVPRPKGADWVRRVGRDVFERALVERLAEKEENNRQLMQEG